MPTKLRFVDQPPDLLNFPTFVAIGSKAALAKKHVEPLMPYSLERQLWKRMLAESDIEDRGRVQTTQSLGSPSRIGVGFLPTACSRHNTPSRAWAVPSLLGAAGFHADLAVLVALDDDDHALATAAAIARSHPTFEGTSKRPDRERDVNVLLLGPGGTPIPAVKLNLVSDAVRLAQDWVDQPPNQMGVSALVAAAEQVAARNPGTSVHVVRGAALAEQGLNGIHSVGRASLDPPALVVLDHAPEGATRTLAWVGKGIVYDTGGLSIKTKTGMPGMKTDMAGAAAVLASFEAAIRLGCKDRICAVLCIAENAVGPAGLRPDDIITLYSGLTVEVNNSDAEGRLVLADGAAWVVKNRAPDVIVDLATLTGAQSMATGKTHAGLYCNDDDLEAKAVAAGKRSGDLVHPLPYVPEFYRREFTSHVADMKNSVKDRSNAQSSCAAQFIGNHLGAYKGPWLHVDMAAPAKGTARATGFGVALLLSLFELA